MVLPFLVSLTGAGGEVKGELELRSVVTAESNPFIGTWKLVSWQVTQPDGSIRYLYGQEPVGYLIYTADGFMSAHIMDPDRQQSERDFPLEPAAAQTLPDADRVAAYGTYLSYCGTYSWEGNLMTHRVKAGLIPSWTGSEQKRRFEFKEGQLILSSGGQKLTWVRCSHA